MFYYKSLLISGYHKNFNDQVIDSFQNINFMNL